MKKACIICCILLCIFCLTACVDSMELDSNPINGIGQMESEELIDLETKSHEAEKTDDHPLYSNNTLEETTMTSPSETNDDLSEEILESSQIPIDTSKEKEEMNSKLSLIVRGKDISYNYFYFSENPRYVGLPFTAVMEELGAVVERKNEDIIHIIFQGETYVLDMDAVTLTKLGSDTNYIIPAPGSKVYFQIADNELAIDHITLNTIAMLMGTKLKIDVDYQKFKVVID